MSPSLRKVSVVELPGLGDAEFWNEVVSRVSLARFFTTEIRLRVVPGYYSRSRLHVVFQVHDRDTGAPTTLRFEQDLPPAEICRTGPDPVEGALRAVRAILQELLRHELDEALLLDGRRVFDPHR